MLSVFILISGGKLFTISRAGQNEPLDDSKSNTPSAHRIIPVFGNSEKFSSPHDLFVILSILDILNCLEGFSL